MEWVSLIPAILAGAFAGIFIGRSQHWKGKYHQEKERWDVERDITRAEIDALRRGLEEYRDAYNILNGKGGVSGQQTIPIGGSSEASDLLDKILVDLYASEQHIIEEEV